MRLLALLALTLPVPALALGPAVLDSPDLRQLSAGPMVYGGDSGITCTFAAGGIRCTDGSTHGFATARSTPVPCEQQQGVWTDAPPNTACVNWRGALDTLGPNTTYLVNGDKIASAPWVDYGAPTVSGTTVTDNSASSHEGRSQVVSAADAAWTLACRLRPGTVSSAQLRVDGDKVGSFFRYVDSIIPGETYSTTATLSGGTTFTAGRVWVGNTPGAVGSVNVDACWMPRAATAGRPCWGSNAAGTTCDSDRHTISTAGWPTTNGKITIVFRADAVPAGQRRYLWDSRAAIADNVSRASILDDQLDVRLPGIFSVPGVNLVPGSIYALVFEKRGSTVTAHLNGAEIYRNAAWVGDFAHGPIAGLGMSGYANTEQLNGSISRLSWSAK